MWVEVLAGSAQEAEAQAVQVVEAAGFGSVVSAVAGAVKGGFALVKVVVAAAASVPVSDAQPLNWV
jgi:hypothetical protein